MQSAIAEVGEDRQGGFNGRYRDWSAPDYDSLSHIGNADGPVACCVESDLDGRHAVRQVHVRRQFSSWVRTGEVDHSGVARQYLTIWPERRDGYGERLSGDHVGRRGKLEVEPDDCGVQ